MKPGAKSKIVDEFVETGRSESCPVIDTHAHMGPLYGIYFPNETVEKMVRTMDKCGIKKLFFAHHRALRDSEKGNRDAEEAIARFSDRLGGYWAVTPLYPDRLKKEVEEFSMHKGFAGFKILAAYYQVKITDPRCRPMWERAHEERLPVLIHTWGKCKYAGCGQVSEIAEKYPGAQMLMAHSQHGDWDGGIELARKFDNVYLELTAAYAVNGAVEKMVNDGAQKKIVFGEDLPWFDPMYGIGCVIFSCISDEARHDILHRNAERIFERWL